MTENKRFTIFGEWHKDCVIDEIRDNTGEYVTIGRVVDLLNENEQLRKEKECDKQVFTKKRLHELLQQTQKENEHIKQTIREAYETERTQIGKNVLKQLMESLE